MGHKLWAVGEEVIATDSNPVVAEQVVTTFPNAAAPRRGAPGAARGRGLASGRLAGAALDLFGGPWKAQGAQACSRSWPTRPTTTFRRLPPSTA